MRKLRYVAFAGLVACVVSSVASGSASAHEYRVAGKPLLAVETFEATSGRSEIASETLGKKVLIACAADRGRGTIEPGGRSAGELTLEGCTITVAGCAVVNITLRLIDELVGPVGAVEDELRPGGVNFGEVEIVGLGCGIRGKYPLTGTQRCRLPGVGAEALEHEWECTPLGSTLTLAGRPATFNSKERLMLTRRLPWSAI